MKKRLATLLTVVMLLTLIPMTTFAYTGSGTAEDPYCISTVEELEAFRNEVNNGNDFEGKYILLVDDIILNGSDGSTWVPIGRSNVYKFKGTFNGGGHEISGLYISSTSYYQGLFGYVETGATIENLSVSGEVTSSNQVIGGIAGYNKGSIINCHSSVYVTGSTQIGGIAGKNSGTVQDCSYFTGTVTSTSSYTSYAGGIVGYNESGNIIRCFNTGTIKGISYVGGITGGNGYQGMESCYNTGEVSGESVVGGLAGFNFNSISNCYSTGKVNGNTDILVGTNSGTVTNSYFLSDTSETEGDCGTVKTSEQFASGEVAYLLNNGVTDGTQAFYQTCGEGIPEFSGKTVYQVKSYYCPGDITGQNIYSNTDQDITGEHSYTLETAEDQYLKSEATCTEAAVYYKSCAFCGLASTTETFTSGTAIGHDWDTVSFEWSIDEKTCTATRICKNDTDHIETETVNITGEQTKASTCTEKGETTYTAVFSADWAETQTKVVADIEAIGHNAIKVEAKAPTATEPGNIEYWYCEQCDQYFADESLTELITQEQTVLAATGGVNTGNTSENATTVSPQTGDSGNITLWIVAMLAAVATLTGTNLYSRRKKIITKTEKRRGGNAVG